MLSLYKFVKNFTFSVYTQQDAGYQYKHLKIALICSDLDTFKALNKDCFFRNSLEKTGTLYDILVIFLQRIHT